MCFLHLPHPILTHCKAWRGSCDGLHVLELESEGTHQESLKTPIVSLMIQHKNTENRIGKTQKPSNFSLLFILIFESPPEKKSAGPPGFVAVAGRQ